MAEDTQNNIVQPKSRPASAQQKQSKSHVLPETLPPDLVRLLNHILQVNTLTGYITWIVDRIPETNDPLELVEHLADRYDQQVVTLKNGEYKDYLPVFRVAFSARFLEVLPYFSMRIVKASYNPLFIKIWLQKRMLADMMGISIADVERRARSSGQRIAGYLSDQIARIYPTTSLAQHLKEKN